MGKSKSKKSRKELKRRKQLKAIEDRSNALKADFKAEDVTRGMFISRHVFEAGLIIFVLAGILFVWSLAPDKKALDEIRGSFDAALFVDSIRWNEHFDQGYKIYAISGAEIIETTFDTLPDKFIGHRKNVSIMRIQESLLDGVVEKLEVTLRDIHYAPQNIAGASMRATLVLQEGASAVLSTWETVQFQAHIIKEHEGVFFCLLGLKTL